jgi:dCTP deaminase
MSAGVLNQEDIQRELIDRKPARIKSPTDITTTPDPSSIDLPLGDRYYEMPASCRPGIGYSVTDLIQANHGEPKDLEPESVFHPGKVYLIRLAWNLDLPEKMSARSTAKSSIGRLDALVRLVADRQPEFDRVSAKTTTELYVELAPITFPLKLSQGIALSQMRFMKGTEQLCTVAAPALEFEDTPVLVNYDGTPATPRYPEGGDINAVILSLDLSPDPELKFAGFVAKPNPKVPIDPSLRKKGEEDPRYDPVEFWESVNAVNRTILIQKDRFYIFRSKERFRVPATLAVECQAYSESLGDIRIHYAGFAHPFFGFDRESGTPLIFEVRGHSVSTILRDGDALAKVYFRRMTNPAKVDTNQLYNRQELQLSGCFKEWPK